MKISVFITTYNHENYIAQCLESILAQQGDFQLEVIVGDDCSTDNNRRIIETYQKQYPDVIKPFPPGPNLRYRKNLKRCFLACTGDYIAPCDGDDYWTDPNKLKKQVAFLEENPRSPYCFNSSMLLFERDGSTMQHVEQAKLTKAFITTEELIMVNYIGHFSNCMYRAEVVRKIDPAIFDLNMADWLFNIACSEFGPIGYIPEIMSVYRIREKGIWSGKSEIDQLKKMMFALPIYDGFLGRRFTRTFDKKRQQLKYQILRARLSHNAFRQWLSRYPKIYETARRFKRRVSKSNNLEEQEN